MFKKNPNVDIDVMRFRLGGSTRYFTTGLFDIAASTMAISPNYLYAAPFFVPVVFQADRIAIRVTTAGAAGTKARIGIYEDNGKVYPGKLLLDSGEIAVDSTGVKEVTISKILASGKLYWLAIISNSSATFRSIATDSSSAGIQFGLSSALGTTFNPFYYYAMAYGALPDPFTSGGSLGSGQMFAIFLRKVNY